MKLALTGVGHALRHPRTTVRWRLALLYGALFLVCGTALLAITYALVAHATRSRPGPPFVSKVAVNATLPPGARPGRTQKAVHPRRQAVPPAQVRRLLRSDAGRSVVFAAGRTQRISDLHKLEVESAIALAIMTILSGALGWLVAGRVLRPVRTMIQTTREISETNLHRRLAVVGPPDELRTLADTIDGLLGRLEGAFDAQRRFVANASHELRTPLTTSRALLEMVTSDPAATVADFRQAAGEALEESTRQEQLIDALLSFAQGQQGLDDHESLRLDEIAAAVLDDLETEAGSRGVTLERELAPATVAGEARLVERLVSNLVANAVRHNVSGGTVHAWVGDPGGPGGPGGSGGSGAPGDPRDPGGPGAPGGPRDPRGGATLRVSNTGPVVRPDQIGRMLAPFGRLDGERIGHGEGFGLGLSIVSAIADAHGAALTLTPRDGGGLDVEVRFPEHTAAAPPLPEPASHDPATLVPPA